MATRSSQRLLRIRQVVARRSPSHRVARLFVWKLPGRQRTLGQSLNLTRFDRDHASGEIDGRKRRGHPPLSGCGPISSSDDAIACRLIYTREWPPARPYLVSAVDISGLAPANGPCHRLLARPAVRSPPSRIIEFDASPGSHMRVASTGASSRGSAQVSPDEEVRGLRDPASPSKIRQASLQLADSVEHLDDVVLPSVAQLPPGYPRGRVA